MIRVRFLALIAAIVALEFYAVVAAAAVSGYSGNVGKHVAVAHYGADLMVFYYDATKGALRQATWNGSTWSFAQLDGGAGSTSGYTGNVGQGIAVAVNGQELDAFYYDATKGALRQATWNGSTWSFAQLDGGTGSTSGYTGSVGQYPTATFITGILEVFYYNATQGALRQAQRNGSTWSYSDVAGGSGSISGYTGNAGQFPTVTARALNQFPTLVDVFFYDVSRAALSWGENSVGAHIPWNFQQADGSPTSDTNHVGKFASSTLYNGSGGCDNGYGGPPFVFYYDETASALRLGIGSSCFVWGTTPLDGGSGSISGYAGNVGQYVATTQYGSLLVAFYYDATKGALREASASGNLAFTFTQVDGGATGSVSGYTGNVGQGGIATTSYGSDLMVFYYDASQSALRQATWNGSTWSFVQLDGGDSAALAAIMTFLLLR